MEKWRKKISLAVLSVVLFALTPNVASAQSCNPCCDPCDWSLCDQTFEIGVDFIYWKPCVDDLDVAAILETSNGFSHVDYKSICLDWEPGFRVFINLPEFFCDWNLSASYTSLKSCNSAKQEYDDADDGNGIISPLIFPASPFTNASTFEIGHQSWDLRYHEWDVLLSYDILCGRCHHFSPYFGVAGICLDQKLDADFCLQLETKGLVTKNGATIDSITNTVKWDSEYWGVGLRFGSAYEYEICSGINAFANANATLLAGEACSKNKQTFEDTGTETEADIKLKDDDCCHFVPGYHIAIGLNYLGCWCDWDIGARLGYEFVNWHNIPNHRVFSGDNTNSEASHSSSASTRTLGFHGLFAGAWISF